jgi:hypothetical protein
MTDIRKRRFIYIDSDKRVKGTSSNFDYPLDTVNRQHMTHCTIMQATIPFSFYLIRDGLNTFQLKETGFDPVTITIPEGNYNLNSFVVVVAPLLNTASPNDATYTMDYPKSFTETNTSFLTITVSGTTSPTLIFNSANTLNEQFGFDRGTTQTFSTNTLSSLNAVNFLVTRSVLIHSDIHEGGKNNVLQEIYSNNAHVNGNIVYQSPDPYGYGKDLRNTHQNTINIYVTDVNGQAIDLKGQDMNITLVLYEQGRTLEILENFINLVVESGFVDLIKENLTEKIREKEKESEELEKEKEESQIMDEDDLDNDDENKIKDEFMTLLLDRTSIPRKDGNIHI